MYFSIQHCVSQVRRVKLAVLRSEPMKLLLTYTDPCQVFGQEPHRVECRCKEPNKLGILPQLPLSISQFLFLHWK